MAAGSSGSCATSTSGATCAANGESKEDAKMAIIDWCAGDVDPSTSWGDASTGGGTGSRQSQSTSSYSRHPCLNDAYCRIPVRDREETCEWVSEFSYRCKLAGKGGKYASEACPGYCSAECPDGPEAGGSPSTTSSSSGSSHQEVHQEAHFVSRQYRFELRVPRPTFGKDASRPQDHCADDNNFDMRDSTLSSSETGRAQRERGSGGGSQRELLTEARSGWTPCP